MHQRTHREGARIQNVSIFDISEGLGSEDDLNGLTSRFRINAIKIKKGLVSGSSVYNLSITTKE